MNKIVSIIVAGAAVYGAYRLFKAASKAEKEKAESIEKHRKTVLEELEGELNQAENWNKGVMDITLNNSKLEAADRAYAYELLTEKHEAIADAKTIKDINDARKGLETFLAILMDTDSVDTIHTILQINADRKAKAEKIKEEKARNDTTIEKYKALGSVVEQVATNVICELVQ